VRELDSFSLLTSFDFFSAFVVRTQVRWIFPADIFLFLLFICRRVVLADFLRAAQVLALRASSFSTCPPLCGPQ
jgi:hypothetical protein